MPSTTELISERPLLGEVQPSRSAGIVRRIRAVAIDPAVRKGFCSVFDQAIVSGTNFATSIVIGRLCAKEQLGTYYLALSLVYFVRGIQEQIVSAPYMVYCNRRQGKSLATYGGSTLIHQSMLSVMTAILLLGLGVLLSFEIGPVELTPVIWVLLGAVPFMLLREYIRHFAFARFQMKTALVIDIVVATIQLASLLVLGYFEMLSVTAVYCVMGLACALACLGWFVQSGKSLRFDSSRYRDDWRENWSFGKWALAGQLVGCSTPYILPWFVAVAHGAAETGVLAACSTLVGIANMFVIGLSNFLSPKAAHAFTTGGIEALRGVLLKTAALFAVTLGGFCLFVLLTGDLTAIVIFGDKYSGAGAIIALLAFGMLANSFAITAGNGLWAIDRPAANFRADLCALVVTIVTTIWLLPSHGALGAAWATLLGRGVDAIIRGFILTRLMKSPQPAHRAM